MASKGECLLSAQWSHVLHRFSHINGVRLLWIELGESDRKLPLILLSLAEELLSDVKASGGSARRRPARLVAHLPRHRLSRRPRRQLRAVLLCASRCAMA